MCQLSLSRAVNHPALRSYMPPRACPLPLPLPRPPYIRTAGSCGAVWPSRLVLHDLRVRYFYSSLLPHALSLSLSLSLSLTRTNDVPHPSRPSAKYPPPAQRRPVPGRGPVAPSISSAALAQSTADSEACLPSREIGPRTLPLKESFPLQRGPRRASPTDPLGERQPPPRVQLARSDSPASVDPARDHGRRSESDAAGGDEALP